MLDGHLLCEFVRLKCRCAGRRKRIIRGITFLICRRSDLCHDLPRNCRGLQGLPGGQTSPAYLGFSVSHVLPKLDGGDFQEINAVTAKVEPRGSKYRRPCKVDRGLNQTRLVDEISSCKDRR